MASKEKAYITLLCVMQLTALCRSGKLAETLFSVPAVLGDIYTQLAQDCPPPAENICPNSDIGFFLYTQETQDSPYLLDPSKPETIENAQFIEGAPLKVIFHGYTGDKDFSPNKELRPAYFRSGVYNIISVDWGKLAAAPCYVQAVQNVKVVAKCAAEFLDALLETRQDVTLENTHLIGFSLGAHAAGLTGNRIKSGKVPRLTAFDPARPMFWERTTPARDMLNREAADFVIVYHSNAGYEGKRSPSGDVDVYFNNGASQPGCNCTSSCDHRRSVEYFTESINSDVGLWGFPCQDWNSYLDGSCQFNMTHSLVELGDGCPPTIGHGNYFVFTNSEPPFLLEPSVYTEDSQLTQEVDQTCDYPPLI